ncbi:MAG: DUF2892 domain-containing protein [Patescibacteria group bacterium]
MKIKKEIILLTAAIILFASPVAVSAHQPRLVTGESVQVNDPEISKAYYGELIGEPHAYHIVAPADFGFYLNLLVPKNTNPKARYSAYVYNAENNNLIVKLDGETAAWKEYFEEFGRDYYYQGPELKTRLPAGNYTIVVQGNGNVGKYVLAIGDKESFSAMEIWNAVTLIPKLKANFFSSSPAGFMLSPFGAGFAAVLMILGFVFGFALRKAIKKFRKKSSKIVKKNIGSMDRLWRASLAVLFFITGIFTWQPAAFLVAGFILYETTASWCAIYAYLGKNTCPMS